MLAGAVVSHADTINLSANDGLGTSSFNSGVHWVGGVAPSAGNDYNTAGFFMRTPGDGVTSYSFGGASLTLGPVNLSGGVNGSMLEKFTGGAGSTRTLTINNFTNSSGAMLRSGGTAGALIHVAGNHYTIAGNSIIQADQCIWVIDAPLLGADGVILTNYANNANDHVAYTANNAGFTGKWYLTGAGTTAWSCELDALNSLPGNPATPTPDQITFLASGQLRDTVGCTYNNSNGGITLAANGNINASVATIIGVPITDLTNGVSSLSSLTASGSGTLVLNNPNNNYAGGTTISAGTLQLGVDNAIPGKTVAGDVTDNAILDLNAHNLVINGLNGSGTIDTSAGGSPTLTIGANGAGGTFSGTIQNSAGTLTLMKIGAGTQILSGGFTYSGSTIAAAGTLNLNSAAALPSTPGSVIVTNGATLTANVSSGVALPAGNVTVGNATLGLSLNPTAIGLNVSGGITLQDNAILALNYGSVTANPTAVAVTTTGPLLTQGTNIVITITATGLKTGSFPLINYSGGSPDFARIQLIAPPGVAATLINSSGSVGINITSTPNQLAWNGASSGSWDLTTANWTNLSAGGLTLFQQYTNGTVVAGDGVLFDDTLFNDGINPPHTNITLNTVFYAFPLQVNSTMPYTISGAGGLAGVTSLVKSNSGSLTLLTSNSFTGGVFINDSGSLVINSDAALGASPGSVTLNGSTLQMNGNVTNSRAISMPNTSTIGVGGGATARLSGVISGAGTLNKADSGMLILAGRETFTGNLFGKGGTLVIDSGGSINNGGNWSSIGQNGTDNATLTIRGSGAFTNTADFNVGDVDSAIGTMNLQDSAVVSIQNFFIASANAAGSTASGTVNMTGGSLIEKNTAVGNFVVGGRNSGSSSGVAVLNLNGGYVSAACGVRVGDYGTGTINQSGGTFEVTNNGTGINLHRENTDTSFGTYNLNGGTLRTEKVTTSFTSANGLFYFNGGTLQAANGNLGTTPFMNNLTHAYVRNGGAVIDSQGYSIIISQPLEHSSLGGDNALDGGLTKLGSGTATLNGVNTFTGSITNKAGTLVLNGASTYANGAYVNAGTLQLTTASAVSGGVVVSNNAILSINQVGSADATIGNLTLSGTGAVPGATVSLAPTLANNPVLPLLTCGTLTLNGTNSISLPVASLGTFALIKYNGSVAGSGNCTNLILPQGAAGYISNYAAGSTLVAVVTNTGPGIFWTGTNSVAGKANLWDLNSTTNWVLGPTPTSYHQVVVPGDFVSFSDFGSGTVLVNSSVAPASLLISNNSKAYTFGGSGSISGPTGVLKLGTGTAVLNLTNNTYTGNTVVSNGTLQVGNGSAIPGTATAILGPGGTLELAGFNQTLGELTGAGILDNNSGLDLLLTVGTSSGGSWNGSIQDHGGGGVALIKNGSGTWVVGGANHLNNGSPFTTTNQFNGGTTILTNGGSVLVSRLQTYIGYGSTASMIVAGGSLAVSNDVLAVGASAGANGTLIVNSGTVFHGGGTGGSFGAANNLVVGALGGTGTLTVNGGQVLNNQALVLGQAATGSGTLWLNGGLVQANLVRPDTGPATSVAYFNGGTLLAFTNSTDFLQVSSMVMSNGLVFDDGGWAVHILSQSLQPGDALGGGLIKQGNGTLYLDNNNGYTGTTLVSGGTLAGMGTIAGPVVVGPAGTLGAGDEGSPGTLALSSTPLTVQGTVAMRISKNGGVAASDAITGISTANYGGTLSVSNATSDATPLIAGDTFTLFSAAGHTGNFGVVSGSPSPALAYSFNPATGVLTVIPVATNPTNITFTVNGSTLKLAWPTDHKGWIAQSNSASVADPAAWVDVPGSQSGTTLNINISPAQAQVFFRLRHP